MNIHIYPLLLNNVKLLKCFQLLTPETFSPGSARAFEFEILNSFIGYPLPTTTTTTTTNVIFPLVFKAVIP